MALEIIEVEIIHEETITPSSPTPQSLKSFTLSVFDQFSPNIYFPLLLFYPKNPDHHQSLVAEKRIDLLKRSLSQTLTRFYPFAGRIHDQFSIFCDDQGAIFIEAHVKCSMSSVLSKLDPQFLKEMIPKMESFKEDEDYALLNVQANFFDCGSIALGFNVCHKSIDAYTLSTFITNWSANYSMQSMQSMHAIDEIVTLIPTQPYVGAASFFPPLELFKPTPQFGKVFNEKCVTKRFVFESSNVACLKSKAASAAVPNPTRVEVVSSLIWKIAMKASNVKKSLDCVRASSSTWLQIVNIRNVTRSCGKDLMGNMLGFFAARSSGSNEDIRDLVAAMRKECMEFKVRYGSKDISVEDVSEIMKEYGEEMRKGSDENGEECYCSSSWCRFPFYEADFGWGKPLMNLPATVELKNLVMLTDTSDGGGVEVRLTLKEEDMALFEMNEELLEFASINPTYSHLIREGSSCGS